MKTRVLLFLGMIFMAGNAFATDDAAKANAVLYAQIEEMKEQMRTMRGDIEQLQYENAKLNDKVVKISADIEFRINELEKEKTKTKPEETALTNIDASLDNDTILKKNDAKGAAAAAAPASDKDAKKGSDFVEKKTKEKTMEQDYQEAYSFVKEKDFKKAKDALQKFVEAYPEGDNTASAYYWLGEINFNTNEFNKAAIAYLKGYQASIRGSRAADNLLKLSKSLVKLDKKKEACTTLQKLKKEFPKAQNAIKQQMEADLKELKCSGS